MKKNIFIILLLVVSFQYSFGQDVYDKLSKNICKCLKKEKVSNLDDIQPCIDKALNKYWLEILDFHNAKTITEISEDEIGKRIAAKLFIKCDYAYKLYTESKVERKRDIIPDSILNCNGLKTGEYYYVNPDVKGDLTDTTYVTFTEKRYIERMNYGKTYSLLSIKWDNNCEFTVTFLESNDIFKTSLSKKGEKHKYEIIKNNDYSMVVKYLWNNDEHFLEYVKVK